MKRNILISILIMFLFLNCSDKDPTAPENETPTEILAEANIGPEGGTLETDDFILNIPQGAFNDPVELKLTIEEDDFKNENSVTPAYQIQGIPAEYYEPLEIKLKYQGSLSGINLISRNIIDEITTNDTSYSDTVVDLLDAIEENGFLKTELPSNQLSVSELDKSVNDNNMSLQGHTSCYKLETEHFIFKSYDVILDEESDEVTKLRDFFEEAYMRFIELKYPNAGDLFPTISVSRRNNLSNWMGISKNGKSQKFRVSIGNNTDISQYRFLIDQDYSMFLLLRAGIPINKWLTRGLPLWAAFKFNPDLAGICTRDAFAYPLLSLGSTGDVALIEFLISKYGDAFVGNVLLEAKNSTFDSFTSVQNYTAPVNEWLSEYYIYLLTNEDWIEHLSSTLESSPDYLINQKSSESLIDNNTSEIIWPESYSNLSAKLFRVMLASNLQKNNLIRFSREGGDSEISLFKYKNKQFEYLATSENTLTSPSVEELITQGYELWALVSNKTNNYPQQVFTDITLRIEKTNVPVITDCAISIYDIDVNKRVYKEDGTYDDIVQERYWSIFNTASKPEPTFENNIFYQAYSFTDQQGFIHSGSFSVQFNESLDKILTFAVNHKEDKTFVNQAYGKSEKGISGHDIPLISSGYNDIYEVRGLEVCEKIYNNIKGSQSGGGFSTWEIISINTCRPDEDDYPSVLTIQVTKN